MTVRWTVRADGDQGAQFAPRPSPIRVAKLKHNKPRGFSSFGRAPPCQGGGGGFEPRNPLQNEEHSKRVFFFAFWTVRGVHPPRTLWVLGFERLKYGRVSSKGQAFLAPLPISAHSLRQKQHSVVFVCSRNPLQ